MEFYLSIIPLDDVVIQFAHSVCDTAAPLQLQLPLLALY